jgi:hypothetical protein
MKERASVGLGSGFYNSPLVRTNQGPVKNTLIPLQGALPNQPKDLSLGPTPQRLALSASTATWEPHLQHWQLWVPNHSHHSTRVKCVWLMSCGTIVSRARWHDTEWKKSLVPDYGIDWPINVKIWLLLCALRRRGEEVWRPSIQVGGLAKSWTETMRHEWKQVREAEAPLNRNSLHGGWNWWEFLVNTI